MSNAAFAPLTDAELAERREFLRRLEIDRAKPDATVVPMRRSPLGLRPIIEPNDEPEDDTPEPEPPVREDNRQAWLSDIDFLIRHERKFTFPVVGEALGEAMSNLEKRLKDRFDDVEELKLAHGKLVNENQSLRLILENLRITQRGERGVDGDRGPPGRDGVQGPAGPQGIRGEKGERGLPTPKIVSWEPDFVKFTATPLLSNGGRGATLPLRELLTAFADMMNAEDDD